MKKCVKKNIKPNLHLMHSTLEDLPLEVFYNIMEVGIVVFDSDFNIVGINHWIEKNFARYKSEIVGRKVDQVFAPYFARSNDLYRETSPVFQLVEKNCSILGVERETVDNRIFLCNYTPAPGIKNNTKLYLVTFTDVTEQKKMSRELENVNRELSAAFALTLPNSKIEHKLKNTPEYEDHYNADSGEITITRVIPDGGYQHVVNALKVLADMHQAGATKILGIEKDIMVKTLIYHDVGKVQPKLDVGQRVMPQNTFEDGKKHAARSAALVKHNYDINDSVYNLIYYHHHNEDELPSEFPQHLLPMHRLVRIVDGLSAGITRRRAKIKIDVDQESITVTETNNHPNYNNTRNINLFTGKVEYHEKETH